ncbi:GNAT family N-acetyltransferase [Streptomyces sp. NPDC006368]|uniref:GNAT family N-acetyltransferase n=1 Tax=Streptomyces sp. NPDC006368 TaxID=3156760 RepID=UPI0033A693AF
MTVGVRGMAATDCAAVARIRVRGWQFAYQGLVPDAFLSAMSVPEETARRRDHLAAAPAEVVNLVAERAGEVVGWACHGPYRDGGAVTADAELYALYVDPAHLSTGVGRALLLESAARATAAGYPAMRLWVLKDNSRARRFYEAFGFAPDGTEELWEIGGASLPELRCARPLSGPLSRGGRAVRP